MGWAPHGARAGDVAVLLEGCIVPFVLRPTDEGRRYMLSGDRYVHGFMPGQQPGVEGMSKQWFEICSGAFCASQIRSTNRPIPDHGVFQKRQ